MDRLLHKDVYERNMEAYFQAYPKAALKFKERKFKTEGLRIEPIRCLDESVSFSVTRPGEKTFMLSGVMEPRKALERKIKKQGRIAPNTPIIIMGMSNMEQVEKYLEAAQEDCLILVYEPSVEIFQSVMETIDISQIINDKPVMLVVEQLNSEDLKNGMTAMMKLDTVASLKVSVSPNYDSLFPKLVKDALNSLGKIYDDMIVTWNTARRYTDVAGENVISNIRHMLHGYNVSQLQNFLKGEIPAFVVSAGPSLNKNIEQLKKVGNKGCIIAVDTAIKPLLNRGILPDFFVIVDGKKPTELMDHPLISKIPLVTCTIVAKGIMDLHKGKKFFYTSDNPLELLLFKEVRRYAGEVHKLYPTTLATGGSVANSAFSLAYFMNAKNIIFVGQDLALTNNRTHADGTFQEKMSKISEQEQKDTFLVEGIHGNEVYTRTDFYRYLKWFEENIESNQMKHVIDATQGGAKIHGTKIMTLERAINKYCVKESDWKEKFNKLPEMMDFSAKSGYSNWYQQLEHHFEEVYVQAKKGQSIYERMEKITSQKELNLSSYKELVKKVGKINRFMNENEYALFVQDNLMHLNFVMRVSIYEGLEDEGDDRLQIAKQGKVMNFYIKHEAKRWMEIAKEVVQNRPLIFGPEDVQGALDRLTILFNEVKNKNGSRVVTTKRTNRNNGKSLGRK